MRDGLAVLPPRSAYLHIPFCHRRCFYCDFAVVPLGDHANGAKGSGSASIQSYLQLLQREIALVKPGPTLATVYIGGGTPSLLSSAQIGALLDQLRQRFGVQLGAEITLEMDPASFDQAYLEAVLAAGVNRVSLGGQSFDDAVLEKLGRRHRRHHLLEACGWLHQAHQCGELKSWSLDLIQNLPGQELVAWKQQLVEAIDTGSPHLSIYELSVEPGTVFAWRQRRGELDLPDDDLAAEQMQTTSVLLRQAGFGRYEISNYALPGHASRHNRVYWSGAGWWAFGQGATSAPWGQRLARPRTRDGYCNWIEVQEAEGLDSSLVAAQARPLPLDEQLLVGLRCREGVDLEALSRAWGWTHEQCNALLPSLQVRWQAALDRGWLQLHGRRWQLSDPQGMAISNQVLVEMLLWWESLPADAVASPNLEGLLRTAGDLGSMAD